MKQNEAAGTTQHREPDSKPRDTKAKRWLMKIIGPGVGYRFHPWFHGCHDKNWE